MVVNLKMRLGQGARRRSSPAGAGAAGERCGRAPPDPPHPRPGAAPLGRDPGGRRPALRSAASRWPRRSGQVTEGHAVPPRSMGLVLQRENKILVTREKLL